MTVIGQERVAESGGAFDRLSPSRKEYKQQLKPTLELGKEANSFKGVLAEYRHNLYSVASDKMLSADILDTAQYITSLNVLQKSSNPDEHVLIDKVLQKEEAKVFDWFR